MGNSTPTMNCPIHKDQKIKYICSQKKCIQPLCEECIKNHRKQHQKLGFSPSFTPISTIIKQDQKYQNLRKQNQKNEIKAKDGEFIPTGTLLKQFTNEYFATRFKSNANNDRTPSLKPSKHSQDYINQSRLPKSKVKLENYSPQRQVHVQDENYLQNERKLLRILSEYELYKKMQNNKQIRSKIMDFFKKNLVLNQGVVGKQFSHLYE